MTHFFERLPFSFSVYNSPAILRLAAFLRFFFFHNFLNSARLDSIGEAVNNLLIH